MKNFAVQIPIKGFQVVVIEAESMEAALEIAQQEGFDAEEEEDGPVVGAMDCIGYCNKDAQSPSDAALDMVRQAFDVDND